MRQNDRSRTGGLHGADYMQKERKVAILFRWHAEVKTSELRIVC